MNESTLSQESKPVAGQMTWRLPGQVEPLLHLRSNPLEHWKPYNECPTYMAPDQPFLSEGYATFVKLLKLNWEIIK
jgi:hypothetical protein